VGLDGRSQLRAAGPDRVYVGEVLGHRPQPVVELHLEVAVQDGHPERREDGRDAVVLDHVEVHLVHHEGLVL